MIGMRHLCGLAATVWLAACHSNPPLPAQTPAVVSGTLSSLSSYARELQQQDEPALLAEKARLESSPDSPARNLRLALLLGNEQAAFYDPERATLLLARTANEPNADPAERSVAQVLLASAPRTPRSCEETGFTRELTDRLTAEEQRSPGTGGTTRSDTSGARFGAYAASPAGEAARGAQVDRNADQQQGKRCGSLKQ